MARACELKKADVVDLAGQLLIVREIDVQNPSARGAATLYKIRFSNIQTRLKHQETFKGDDLLKTVDMSRRAVTFSYVDGDKIRVHTGEKHYMGRAGPGASAS